MNTLCEERLPVQWHQMQGFEVIKINASTKGVSRSPHNDYANSTVCSRLLEHLCPCVDHFHRERVLMSWSIQ